MGGAGTGGGERRECDTGPGGRHLAQARRQHSRTRPCNCGSANAPWRSCRAPIRVPEHNRDAVRPARLRAVSEPADFRLRRAVAADLAALVELERASFSYDRMSERQFRRHLRSDSAAVLVAEGAGGLLGSAVLFFRRGTSRARLYSLAAAAAARGRGIGAALLAAAETLARERGLHTLSLEVRRDNAAAVRLYESRGYRRIAALENYYDDGAAAWRYAKSLTDPTP